MNDASIKTTYIVFYAVDMKDDSITLYNFEVNKTVLFISSDHSVSNANKFDALSINEKKESFSYKCIRTYTNDTNVDFYYKIYFFHYNPLYADQRYNIYYF